MVACDRQWKTTDFNVTYFKKTTYGIFNHELTAWFKNAYFWVTVLADLAVIGYDEFT